MEWLTVALGLYFAGGGLFAASCAIARRRCSLGVELRVLLAIVLIWPALIWLALKDDR